MAHENHYKVFGAFDNAYKNLFGIDNVDIINDNVCSTPASIKSELKG